MALDGTKNTGTTDSKSEQDEVLHPDQLDEQDPRTSADENTDAATDSAAVDVSEDDDFENSEEAVSAPVSGGAAGGFASGAAAVVSFGLGLSSLTGTALGDMLRARMEVIGQIALGGGTGSGGVDQVQALYGDPWHAAAFANGIFAVLAVLVGGAVLAVYSGQANGRTWVRSVALGGFVLGLGGALIAGGMYFDLLAPQPQLPGAGG